MLLRRAGAFASHGSIEADVLAELPYRATPALTVL
jgi:hypothetical protein